MRYILIISNMIFVMNTLFSQTYSYDHLNRLISANYGNGYTITYQYDKLGNRTKKIVTAGCQSITLQSAYFQSFEFGLGDWTQIETDNENWTTESGTTLTSSTGPSSAIEGSSYLYTENSSRTNKSMILQSGCYDLADGSSFAFTMDYHMYGSGINRLRVQISVNGGAYSNILDRSGNQGNSWKQFSSSLASHQGKTIRFRIIGNTGSSSTGDIAIDNIRIGSNCPTNLVVSNTLSNVMTTLPGDELLAENQVTSTAILSNGSFHFGAGQCVEMNGGFEVKSGVQFIADNNGCVILNN